MRVRKRRTTARNSSQKDGCSNVFLSECIIIQYMSVVERVRDDVFAEPSGRRLNWLAVGYGVIAIGIAATGLTDSYLEFIFLGLGFVFMGSAELVSSDRRHIAGVLRLCSIAILALFGILSVAAMI